MLIADWVRGVRRAIQEDGPKSDSGTPVKDDLVATARRYWRSAGRYELAHHRAAEIDSRRHRRIGLPSVIVSTFVATTIFTTLSETVDTRVRIGTGIVAVLGAILTALQAFLGLQEDAEKHQVAAARYGKVRRAIDVFLLEYGTSSEAPRADGLAALQKISEELSSANSDSPSLREAEYLAGKTGFDATHTESP